MLVCTIGRRHLPERFQTELQSAQVRIASNPELRRAYQLLANLKFRESGTVYTCPAGQQDDLGISCALMAWAARHRNLDLWLRN